MRDGACERECVEEGGRVGVRVGEWEGERDRVADRLPVDDRVVVGVPVAVFEDDCVTDWLPLVDGVLVFESVEVGVAGCEREPDSEELPVLDAVLAVVAVGVCVGNGVAVPEVEGDCVSLLDDERDGLDEPVWFAEGVAGCELDSVAEVDPVEVGGGERVGEAIPVGVCVSNAVMLLEADDEDVEESEATGVVEAGSVGVEDDVTSSVEVITGALVMEGEGEPVIDGSTISELTSQSISK